MAGQQELRFSHAADNTRPFKSHRYPVFGVKIQRGLSIFGELALSGFIALESDPTVVAYCERPIVINELNPRRVVDFWVQKTTQDELWFLLRPSELKWLDRDYPPTRAFSIWAETRSLTIRLWTPESLGVGSLHLRNWGEIIRYLTTNLQYLDAALLKRVTEYCTVAHSLGEIQAGLPQDDPILVRTAVFRLMHLGILAGVDLGDVRLGLHSVVKPS